jgi:probable serine/threonine-protein kinase pats1
MKRVLKLTLFVVILIMTMMMSKTVLADERKDAKVDYEYNSDGTAKVTITFSESVEGFNTLIESGWQLSGNTATKKMDPGEWYIYMSDTEQAKVVVNNIAKVGDTITINSSSNNSTLKNLRLRDESYGTVSGNKITFNKEGETSYLADVTYVKDENTVGNFTLTWKVKITKDGKNPVNPTDKEAVVTYGDPTDAGVLVTVKFSQNLPDTDEVKQKLSDWQISGDTATRTMPQGAIASIIIKYEDGSKETAKVAVPLTLEIGSQMDFSGMAKDLKIDDTGIATVENGIVKAKAKGTTKMTGTSLKDGNEYTWTINVNGTDNGNDNNDGKNNGENNDKNNNNNNGNGSSDKSTKGNDGTTANKKLSQTGYASILPVGVILISFVVISFIKYKKNNK